MEDAWPLLAVLSEPVRRALYSYVRVQHRPVTREEAARACAISRSLAAFHLDKLVDAGLLRARNTASGAGGGGTRGRGRPPKEYESTDAEIRVAFPGRRYDLLGAVLVDALAADPAHAGQAALSTARRRGREIGQAALTRRRREGASGERRVSGGQDASAAESERHDTDLVVGLLGELGYEPYRVGDGAIAVANCPFRDLARRQPELVCTVNRAFCEGLLEGLGVAASVVLRPPTACCVEVRLAGA